MKRLFDRVGNSRGIAKARAVLLYGGTELSNLITAVAATLWGLWILLPIAALDWTVGRFASVMGQLAPESVWGVVAITVGLSQLAAVLYDMKRLCMWASLAAFLLWSFVVWFMVFTVPPSPHLPLYVVLALTAGWGHLRAGLLAARADIVPDR